MSNISFTSIFYLCISKFATINVTISTDTIYSPSPPPPYTCFSQVKLIRINKTLKESPYPNYVAQWYAHYPLKWQLQKRNWTLRASIRDDI